MTKITLTVPRTCIYLEVTAKFDVPVSHLFLGYGLLFNLTKDYESKVGKSNLQIAVPFISFICFKNSNRYSQREILQLATLHFGVILYVDYFSVSRNKVKSNKR